MIKALNAYKKNALKAKYFRKKTAVLWILLLQKRHFVSRKLTVLDEFKVTLDKLTAKDLSIRHAEVPFQLSSPNPNKRKYLKRKEK